MKKLTRRGFTAAGILAALSAGMTILPGCELESCGVQPSLYGPPPGYDPKKNELEDVYGPPEDFKTSENELVDVYGPPEDFEPDENEAVAVYGPPEWFETNGGAGDGRDADGESDGKDKDDPGSAD